MKEAAVSIRRFPEGHEKKRSFYIFIAEFLFCSTVGNKYNKPKAAQGVLQPSTSNKPRRQDIKIVPF